MKRDSRRLAAAHPTAPRSDRCEAPEYRHAHDRPVTDPEEHERLLASLNDCQREAVTAPDGPTLVGDEHAARNAQLAAASQGALDRMNRLDFDDMLLGAMPPAATSRS